MSLLEQLPCFATNKHFVMANSQGHHILHRSNLQDLRMLKFTKQVVQTRHYNQINVQVYTNSHEGRTFRQYLARNINLRGIFFSIRGLVAVTAVATAVARVILIGVA
jgi:hypothetical protein